MSIYDSPYFFFKAGSLKGKTRKEIEEFFDKQRRNAKRPKVQPHVSALDKRKAQLRKKYKEKNQAVMNEKLKVLYFSATWCGPCKTYKPVFTEVVNSFGEDIDVQIVDVDEESQLAADHAIRSIPTTVIFKGKSEIFRQTGVIGKAWLTNYIQNNK